MSSAVCPHCHNLRDETTGKCVACGHVEIPPTVTLRSKASKSALVVRTTMELGRGSLGALNDPDINYCDSGFQFRLTKSTADGGWVLEANPHASNPVWLNRAPVPPGGVKLQAGDELSLKDKKLFLSVEL